MLDIKIIGTNQNNPTEYAAAETLASVMKRDIPNYVRGKILIKVGMVCFGQDPRDIDIVVFGEFEKGYRIELLCEAEEYDPISKEKKTEDAENRKVFINNFCFAIEVKSITLDKISFRGECVLVKYAENWCNATEQNEKQKVSLFSFLPKNIGIRPAVNNFIWLRSVQTDQIPASFINNVLPAEFTFHDLIQKHVLSSPRKVSKFNGNYSYTALKKDLTANVAAFQKAFDFFEIEIRSKIGGLTRDKIEKITKDTIIKDQEYIKSIGKRMVIIRGRAGTGKTMRLLRIAHALCIEQGMRCLILTYNHVLVSDIQRLIALSGISDDIASATVGIRNIHQYMVSLMKAFKVHWSYETEDNEFEDRYKDACVQLFEKIIHLKNSGAFKELITNETSYDRILIDEGQDWPAFEKNILFELFQTQNMVVADGVDQMVRTPDHAKWDSNVEFHKPIPYGRKSLRQANNLCIFNSTLAEANGLPWDIENQSGIAGGEVYIYRDSYTENLHHQHLKDCLERKNSAYDLILLVPNKNSIPNWVKNGSMQFWDGTNSSERKYYPSDINQQRMLYYQSCRGLEGWTVVCHHFDVFLQQVYDTYKPVIKNDELALESEEDRKRSFVKKWMMIPLTRPIMRLVISLKNPENHYSKLLIRESAKLEYVIVK
jgi:DNA replication protein DnaC